MTYSNLVHLLQTRAQQQPNQLAYTFLENGKTPTSQVTYRQLDQQASIDRRLPTNSTLSGV